MSDRESLLFASLEARLTNCGTYDDAWLLANDLLDENRRLREALERAEAELDPRSEWFDDGTGQVLQ